jgi:putative phosphoribosyl transferase
MNRVSDFLMGSTQRPYSNRTQAGQVLGVALSTSRELDNAPNILVLGMARGGVPVAAEVAAALGAQLDVTIVRKLGVPGHEELAFGAITADRMVLNDSLIRSLGIPPAERDAVVARERRELTRRAHAYRGGRPAATLTGRTVLLVDDGMATGASMRVAALDARQGGAAKVIVAVPTAPASAAKQLTGLADGFVCTYTPRPFVAVGMSYSDFAQTEDAEVCALLNRCD